MTIMLFRSVTARRSCAGPRVGAAMHPHSPAPPRHHVISHKGKGNDGGGRYTDTARHQATGARAGAVHASGQPGPAAIRRGALYPGRIWDPGPGPGPGGLADASRCSYRISHLSMIDRRAMTTRTGTFDLSCVLGFFFDRSSIDLSI